MQYQKTRLLSGRTQIKVSEFVLEKDSSILSSSN